MKDAIGGSALLYIVIIIVSIIILFFIGALSYSKAYKVKNSIVEALEVNEVKRSCDASDNDYEEYENSIDLINENLKKMGYDISDYSKVDKMCNSSSVQNHLIELGISESSNLNSQSIGIIDGNTTYNYCLYKVTNKTNNGYYYLVVAFVHFDFPVIGDRLTIPVYGQTKILGKKYCNN